MKKTVKEIKKAYKEEILNLRDDKKNSNRSKLIQRNTLMLQFLATVPNDLVIDAECTPTNPDKVNAGSLAECILRYHMTKEQMHEIAKSGGLCDAKRGCINVEIKLSVNGSCYNTPIREKCLIYLINRDGVYMVRVSEIDDLAPKGKLPFTEWEDATRIEYLSQAMGY